MRPALRFPLSMAGALAGAALLLLLRPYEGLQHDGLLYFGQALRRSLMPGLDADLFFAGGSQDSYSLYSRLVAPLFVALGPAAANQALLLLGLLGTALGVALLLRRLDLHPAWGMLALAVMSPMYGGLRKFGVTENFLTARSLAEPLVVASLLPLLQGRLALATAVQLGAAALHPLMALPALVVTWLVAAQRDRRWLGLGLLALAGLAMCLGVPSMARWRATYDPVWWELMSTSSTQLLLGNWTTADVSTVLTDVITLTALAVTATLPLRARPALLAVVWATAAMLLTHAVGTDLLRSTWITQLQPWRVLWLTHLLATVLAPALIWSHWRQGGLWRLSAALLALTWMCSHAGYDAGVIVLIAWALTCLAAARGYSASTGVVRLGVGACGALLIAVCAGRVSFELERLWWRPPTWPALDAACHVLAAPVLAFSLAAGALWLAQRGPRCRKALAAGAVALFALSLTLWDRRGDLARLIESPPEAAPSSAPPFSALIPEQASVYWPEQLGGVWGLLRRTSHYSRQQGSGMAFNRATAELIGPRRDAYAGIRDDLAACEAGAALQGTPAVLAACSLPSPARLRTLCSGPVHPEYFVFERPLRTPPRAVWTHGQVTLHLYACTQFDAVPAGR